MNKDEMRRRLITAGVNSLGAFGYRDVRPTNILTDVVFAQFFATMLRDNLGQDATLDLAINELLAECEAAG